jgi:riboflavin kinase/FMN adenylyltransferase
MEVLIGFEKIQKPSPAIVTVGTFDGVHMGHKQIIHSLVELADEHKLRSTLVTFRPHPQLILKQKENNPIYVLTNMNEKLCLLEKLGLERVIIIEFTREFSEIGHQEFIDDMLIKKLNMRYMIVGNDHAFGKNRGGSYESLKIQSETYQFGLHRIPPYRIENERISSSLIRKLLIEGDVDRAGVYLGRNYSMRGIIVKGEGRGRHLNFPTANIESENHDKLIPKRGVYAVACKIGNTYHRGMANIGYKPTFDGKSKTVEVHIFDFAEDIYGLKLDILFLKRLRSERKFINEHELIKQLNTDKLNSTKIKFDLEVQACL